jgi:D-sedoheptulose 7-phosphate isomerase
MTPHHAASEYLGKLQSLVAAVRPDDILPVARILLDVCRAGGTVFVCGNGGSASTASHMAADLSKNVTDSDHNRLRVMSLTDNMAHFSAIANDLDYSQVFVDQLRNMLTPRDALVAISASGNSPNVLNAARFAREHDVPVIALTGFAGGTLRELGTSSLHVGCEDYGLVEDLHLVFNHLLVTTLRVMIHAE